MKAFLEYLQIYYSAGVSAGASSGVSGRVVGTGMSAAFSILFDVWTLAELSLGIIKLAPIVKTNINVGVKDA